MLFELLNVQAMNVLTDVQNDVCIKIFLFHCFLVIKG